MGLLLRFTGAEGCPESSEAHRDPMPSHSNAPRAAGEAPSQTPGRSEEASQRAAPCRQGRTGAAQGALLGGCLLLKSFPCTPRPAPSHLPPPTAPK
jgi:hypothetical protein